MKIHEFQAKKIFSDYDIPVPDGETAKTPEAARKIAEKLGCPVVVKAQIHAGGRGKGGGVKLARTPGEAFAVAGQILGMNLVTHQTGPEGQKVKQVLIEKGQAIEKELYLGIVVDRAQGCPVIMASEAGGMEIEEVAAKTPEKIIRAAVDPAIGFSGTHARKIAYGLNLDAALIKPAGKIIAGLYRIFTQKNCSLIEINPFVITRDRQLLALDGKINFEDDALSRHPDIKALYDPDEQDPLELEASKCGLNYIKLDGNVGCMVNGAGLAMATMDLIKLAGGEPANFLDVGGGASAEQVENALKILLMDKNVKVVLINIFGGILRCDRVAKGIVQAVKDIDLHLPMIIRLEGTNVAEAGQILETSGLDLEFAANFDEAAQKVTQHARA